MKTYYSIEVKFSYEDLEPDQIDLKASEAKKELEKLAKKSRGKFNSFDEDIGIDKLSKIPTRLGLNYNWDFFVLDDIIQFINNLPNQYQILWIHNNNSEDKSGDSTYIIFSTFNKPETIKFTETDKKLYRILLEKLKSKQN